jgi:prevent-host-death family protein
MQSVTRTVKVQEAKTHLSALLAAVERGEDIVIARGDRPVAKLVALAPAGTRQLGGLDYHLDDDFFDDLPDEELAAWEA